MESYFLYRQRIDMSKIKRVEINPKYTVKKLSYENYENSIGLKFDESKLNIFSKRFESSNYAAYGILDAEALVYSSWISTNQFEVSINTFGLEIELDEALLLDCLTHPKHRGKGLHNYMNRYCLEKMMEHKRSKALVLVIKENIPAQKSQQRSGFKKIKVINSFSFFGKKNIRVKEIKC
tara:strand:+ start:221 stop:757 length:537 start_codon:yes stop_codon:yes gene_type:complete